ncbi:MAG: multicopper oxidase domain-containing protein, partial [Mycolicibacterium sp.]|nr:multicopper oxidase domain-containing protein [Mycolicibacterium sp.]
MRASRAGGKAADITCSAVARRLRRADVADLRTKRTVGGVRPSLIGVQHDRRAGGCGGVMSFTRGWIALALLSVCSVPAMAQSFRVQCPTSTITHPVAANNNSEPAYVAPTYPTPATPPTTGTDYTTGKTGPVNGAIKCQQISGGDGYATMADGTQTYMFSFGPLSGLADIAAGKPGTEFPNVFNTIFPGTLQAGDPATADGASDNSSGYNLGTPGTFTYNGAVGLTNDLAHLDTIYDISGSGTATACVPGPGTCYAVTVVLNAPSFFQPGDKVVISGAGTGYDNTAANPYWTVSQINTPNTFFAANQAFQFTAPTPNLPDVNESSTATVASLPGITGKVDPRPIIDVGVMNGNIPAPLMAFDEDDEFFLTLTNVGMIMRPDLFEQHTVHFHGYPNASSFYDGVPDASVAINIGGSFTYYYLAPDAGT